MTGIVIALQDFHRGGTERVAIDLARLWTDAGRTVTILCGDEGGGLRDTVDPRVMVVALDPPVRRGCLSRAALARGMSARIGALGPDTIFLPGNYHLFLANALRRAAPGAAIVLKISNPPVPGHWAAPVFRHFTHRVDGFAAMNGGLARDVTRLFPGRRVTTLYDPVHVAPAAAPLRREDVLNILWIGRLEPQKDAGLALDVARALGPAAHLTMLGDGAQSTGIDRRIAQERLPVTRLGHVADIAPHLAGADALLITSRYEGGPAVAVESLAQGVPVVSTDCSHLLREIMTTPEAGRIVPSRDPAALAAALRGIGRPRAERLKLLVTRFEPRACAEAYLDFFDSLAHDA
jgi:glycosyltransferase involved in cell wall biosynthesis